MFRRALVLLLVLAGCGGDAGAPESFTVELGGLAELERDLAQRREGCLLNVWATWCPPCVAELPDLVEVAKEHADDGLAVLGVSYDLMVPGVERAEVAGIVRGFLDARGLPLDTLVYEAEDFATIDARFELPGPIPVTLALDREGRIVDRHEGEASRERFRELARAALGEARGR